MSSSSFNPSPSPSDPTPKSFLPHLSTQNPLENEALRILNRLKMVSEDLEISRLESKEATEKLSNQTFFLSSILESIPQGVLFINKEGSILLCNSLAASYLRSEKQTLLNRSFYDFFPDRLFGFSLRAYLFYGTTPPKARMHIQRDLEIELFCLSATFPDPIEGIFLFLKEIPKEPSKTTEKDFHRFYELGKMTASISHDIRNQLGGIRGFTSLLLRDLEEMPHLQDMAKEILETTKELEYSLTSALTFSKELSLSLTPVNMSHFFKELIDFFKKDPDCPEWVQFTLHLPPTSLEILVDPIYLKSALVNLLLNAIEAIDKKGKITLSYLEQNDHVVITLSDSGKGIPQKDIEKLFSPYFTTKESGHGIGLTQVEKIIHAHNGRIEVHSQEQMGTTFSLYLPINKETENETRKNPHC